MLALGFELVKAEPSRVLSQAWRTALVGHCDLEVHAGDDLRKASPLVWMRSAGRSTN